MAGARRLRGATWPVQRSLDRIPVLACVPEAVRRDIEKRCVWKEYKPDEQIIDRDSENRDVFFVVGGTVRIVNYSYSGREVSYDDIRAGGMFGELSAIDGKPRSASVVALRRTMVGALSPETFKRVLREHPDFASAVIERLAAIIRASNDRIMDLSTLGAYTRVYGEILRLARTIAKEEDETALIDPLPVHSDLAARCGTTRETVARAISDLIKKHVAEKQGSGLKITDLSALMDIVEGGDDG
ncbi:MAG: Crp/Fnr family transcriptional regulator [Rhodospirillaceae bacterium]|nr:Crp/Fnr family transcriptional regulator [Rhodospirillaceae bacterium]